MEYFGPATRAWFQANFSGPTPVQEEGWRAIAAGKHSLLLAPTGSGKTLAAFLWAIDRLVHEPSTEERPPGVRVLYVSPLKALAYDVERNLQSPLVGIRRAAEREGIELSEAERDLVGVRTGDTPARDRERMRRTPPPVLVTTPESLYLMLGSRMREALTTVETVIVDEVHALVPTKRGSHLALSLERLAAITAADPQRIGLSATARPTARVAEFLGGDREVEVVDTSQPPSMDVRIVVPVDDMERPHTVGGDDQDDELVVLDEDLGLEDGPVLGNVARQRAPKRPPGIWPALHEVLLETIHAHRTTIVFVNSRGLCERLAGDINQLHEQQLRIEAGVDPFEEVDNPEPTEPLVRAHHGSLALAKRRETEAMLKQGGIRGIVATSSLELGIDMAAVEHVVMVEAPKSVASGLQRIGRAGHGVGETSMGTLLPKHRGDLLESAVVLEAMRAGRTEALDMPRNALDVLAQQIVAAVATEPTTVTELEALVRRAAPYRQLTSELLTGVLDMCAGRYPSTDFADLRPRLEWDRATGRLEPRRGSKNIALTSGGTIPDRGLYAVHMGLDGPRVGELDEEMVNETRPGHVIALGASSWRVLEITRDRVVVDPAPGEPGRLPFWRGEGPGRPIELGRRLGTFLRQFERSSTASISGALQREFAMDERAARNLARYLDEQREATSTLPTDRRIVIERFRDELGDWRVAIHSPFGGRVHAPWALAIENTLSERAGFDVQALWSDDGIVLRFVDGDELPDADLLMPPAEVLEERVVEQLGHSALFAGLFRENAGRALLLPRRRPGERAPLWMQRLKAQNLLAVARSFPSFPIVLETYRSALRDVFDLPAAVDLLRSARAGEVEVQEVETDGPSPFARSLVFAFTAAYLYEGDAPLAERRAQALALDRDLLRELLGADELRELLDSSAIDEFESELQRLEEGWKARSAGELHDLLRQLGDLSLEELVARSDGPAADWVEELEKATRTTRVRIADSERWIAVEDVSTYRDALGCVLERGLPDVFLEPAERPLEGLVARYARTHGPFTSAEAAARLGIAESAVVKTLQILEAERRVESGGFRPNGVATEWVDLEILRRLKQKSLARLRREVAPVERSTFARFLGDWHGLARSAGGDGPSAGRDNPRARLQEVLLQMEGLPLPLSDLEGRMLTARVPGYTPGMLDELLANGTWVWIGQSALGTKDGVVALHRREGLDQRREAPPRDMESLSEDLSDSARSVFTVLTERGACFYTELRNAQRALSESDLDAALWELVWAGLVTNDTLDPLRRRGAGRGSARRPSRRRPGRTSGVGATVGGRWSLVANLFFEVASATERAHARAVELLERHGVVTRETVAAESIPGGFSAIYPVLREMEEAGRIRRGYFVEGLGGAQFALPGAVDRLRAARRPEEEPRAGVLAAQDPAQPFGSVLSWPETRLGTKGLRRTVGASVVTVEGELVAYAGAKGRSITTTPLVLEPRLGIVALQALRAALRGRGRSVRVQRIDDQPVLESDLRELFVEAGFVLDFDALYAAL